MTRLSLTVWFLCGGVVLLPLRSAAAQDVSAYRAMSPPLSPWLSLYRHDTGPLDNYHTFVRPQLQLRETIRKQDSRIQMLGQEVTQFQENGGVPPTGTGSVFMSYSHYYPTPGSSSVSSSGSSGNNPPVPRRHFAVGSGNPVSSYRFTGSMGAQ